MNTKSTFFNTKSYLFAAITVWLFVNLVQSYFTALHPDEAYYWIYSRYLAFGYFDHPPMVALFIKIGYFFIHNTLGVRLLTTLSTSASLLIGYYTILPYSKSVKAYIAVSTSILIFHVYGFTSTPDAPLFLFVALFYYVYRQYLQTDNAKNSLLLAIIITAMLYSKYHAVLPIFFTVVCNLNLLKRRSFWFIVLLSAILLTPHVYWQYTHGFPSIKYHLGGRANEGYKVEYTINYLLGVLLLAGPITGFLFHYYWSKIASGDVFLKTLKINAIGTLVFFLASSFRTRAEAHWILIALYPATLLASIYLSEYAKNKKLFYSLAIINIIIIVCLRAIFIIPFPFSNKNPLLASYFGVQKFTHEVAKKAGNRTLVFQDRFQEPSWYTFYSQNHTQAFALNSWYYRKNQYDILDIEDSAQNKPAYYLSRFPFQESTDTITINEQNYYGLKINSLHSYQKVKIDLSNSTLNNWKAGENRNVELSIKNDYPFPIHFSDANTGITYSFIQNGQFGDYATKEILLIDTIPAGKSITKNITIKAPKLSGEYQLNVTLHTLPFTPYQNSNLTVVNILP